jgi:hypothetical protein
LIILGCCSISRFENSTQISNDKPDSIANFKNPSSPLTSPSWWNNYMHIIQLTYFVSSGVHYVIHQFSMDILSIM